MSGKSMKLSPDSDKVKERQGSVVLTVLNPANISAFAQAIQNQNYTNPQNFTNPQQLKQEQTFWHDEFAKINLKALDRLHLPIQGLQMNNNVLHHKLKDKLADTLNDIKMNMVSRFAIILPYDEAQSMLMSEQVAHLLQDAGRLMGVQYMHASYKLGETVTLNLSCRGGNKMPAILFPSAELTNFSEDFLDLIRPLYLITKSWMDVMLAFEAVVKIVQDTRELNFYVPWLKHIFPNNDLTNEFNSKFRVTQWLDLDRERHSTIDLITRQVKYMLNNEYSSKRTWMPSELVRMVRQGEELITQYNIMKSVVVPNKFITDDHVSVEIVINVRDHPTIKWASEATSHRIMNEAERLKAADEKRANKLVEETLDGKFRRKR